MKMIGRTVFLLFVTMAFLTACSTPTVSSDDSDEVSSSSKKENQPESSSSSVDKKESSSEVKRTSWDYLNPDIDYGELVDKRDGQIYKTVKIGVQMWMAENLNYASSEGSFCYGNSADSCAKYGRLYTWAAAMDSAGVWSANGKGCGDEVECLPTHPVRGVCPEGWHLPTTDEWDPLLDALNGYVVAGRALKSRSGWYDNGDGTDVAGFSALPAGTIQQNGWSVGYHNAGDETGFWCSTQYGSYDAIYMHLFYNLDLANTYRHGKDNGYSVRCVNDSMYLATPCKTKTEDKCEYGELTDDRDGQKYKTVKIGDQWWMARNLNYADSSTTTSLNGKSWCYNNESDSCSKYGRLYTWSAAMDSVKLYRDKSIDCGYGKICSLRDTVYGICPPGWHLPSQYEWNTLFRAVVGGDKALKSQTGWTHGDNGTDAYGFSALPAGGRYGDYFGGVGDYTYCWSASEYYSGVSSMSLSYDHDDVDLFVMDKGSAYSIRCLKD